MQSFSTVVCFLAFFGAQASRAACTSLIENPGCRVTVDGSEFNFPMMSPAICQAFCERLEIFHAASHETSLAQISLEQVSLAQNPPMVRDPLTFAFSRIEEILKGWPLDFKIRLNTSNPNKLAEFQRMFGAPYQLSVTKVDLKEIDSTPEKVAIHKAVQMGDGILVEDTSLDVEGADVGVNVKWLLKNLAQYENRAAKWTVLVAIKKGNFARLCRGVVLGTLVNRTLSENQFGFDPVFIPAGSTKTLSEEKPDHANARYLAVQALKANDFKFCSTLRIPAELSDWQGEWQKGQD